jgi:predicted permease
MERELDAELRFHFDRLVDDNLRMGMSAEAARRSARARFGGLDQVKEDCRDARGTRWAHEIAQDARFALRLLLQERVLTGVAVLALGCGLGVNTMLFTIVNALCIRGLPIERPERTVFVSARDARDRDRPLSPREFEILESGVGSFSSVAAYTNAPVTVGDEGRAPDRAAGTSISANAFGIIGQQPLLGRGFRPDDDRPGASAVVILGSRLWKSRYAGDPLVIGRTIRVNGAPATVIGVMPDGFRFPGNADVWQPLWAAAGFVPGAAQPQALDVIARLVEQATIPGAREDVRAAGVRLSAAHPETNKDARLALAPINDRVNGNITDPAWLAFLTAGALVVLIACANVANMLLARAVRRSREMAIRLSLGATRGRIIRQLLAESAILALLGGLAGLSLAALGLRLFASAIPENALPYWVSFAMDARVFVVLTAACLGTVLLFGLAPALHVSKASVNDVLKDGSGTSSSGIAARRWTSGFLTAEFALTVVLLAGVGLTFHSFQELQRKDPPIDASGLLTTWLTLPSAKYRSPEERLLFYRGLQERLDAIGAISSASLATTLPYGGAPRRRLLIDGRPIGSDAAADVLTVGIGVRYFQTVGLRVSRGRAFTDEDGTSGRDTAIVNQRLADMFFAGDDAIGRRIRTPRDAGGVDQGPWLTIVGISPTVRQRALPDPDPVVYVPFRATAPATAVLLVRGHDDPGAIVPLLREEVRALDPNLPLYRAMTLQQAAWESGWNGRVSAGLITTIAFIALGLATIGLSASTAHAVVQRTREIGIRVALGARPGQVMVLILRRGLLQIGAGLAAGAVCAFIWERLFGAPGTLTAAENLLAVAAVLIVVAGGACLWPARRAARLDPVRALRYD